MRIGYACLTVGVSGTDLKSCTLKTATEAHLRALILHNLTALERMIEYNLSQNIRLFRISSDIIPFGSSPVNTINWSRSYSEQLTRIGQRIQEGEMRVSMHPGQYTVLNSPDEGVVARAIDDLLYHTLFLDSLGLGSSHKIVLHVGGVYQDREAAIARFVKHYHDLPVAVKSRLVIENDDRLYSIDAVLRIGKSVGIPVIFDNLHHAVNKSASGDLETGASGGSEVGASGDSEVDWIRRSRETWKPEDGPQKVHYSQQDTFKRPGAHTQTIALEPFMAYAEALPDQNIDIMLEVKDKNLSALKVIHALDKNRSIATLEGAWAKYKYNVLEHSHKHYEVIRSLLKDKTAYPVLAFYNLIDEALAQPLLSGGIINAADHVWGYFKDLVSQSEKNQYISKKAAYIEGRLSHSALKGFLRRLAQKYESPYLLESYYFEEL